ncbi:MFS transporter [Pseudonocardia humida]|uniref:MFS transporter n=1 Tax=Pseudonocardia humida TaxID=2800819 RepID=A0ABT1A3P2_9PSEU|nr:MFS transporter [Pseudonocardia humida]MCO1657561.1 MFS transporter [Pseudonocardia humida]
MTPPSGRAAGAAPAVRPLTVLLGLLALAVNLRAALAGYPPLLETAREDLALSAGAAGLVQSGAVLMMAVGSFAGSAVGLRFGRETALGVAVGLVALGSLVRGVPALGALVAGSLVLGLGVGLAGVLLAGVVKEHLPDRAGAVTGGYTVSMMIGATTAGAVAVPLAVVLGGWSFSLAVWAAPAALALGLWVPVARRAGRPAPGSARPAPAAPWRSSFARRVTVYQLGTSSMFYGGLTWLAPYYEGLGWSPQGAGLLIAVWSLAQIPSALVVPVLAERSRRWRFWSGITLACALVGAVGVLAWPQPPLVGPWGWIALMGFGLGAGFPLGLSVIAWRTADGAASAATSGLALGTGYVCAGLVPLLMGVLIDLTAGFAAALAVLLVAGAVQGAGIIAIGDRPPPVENDGAGSPSH